MRVQQKSKRQISQSRLSVLLLISILAISNSANGARLIRQERSYTDGLALQDQQIMFLEKLRESTSCDDSKNKCMNGGQCYESQCYCHSPYIGPYCQYYLEIDTYIDFWQMVGICAFSLVFGCIATFFVTQCIENRQKEHDKLFGEGYGEFEIWDRNNKKDNNKNTENNKTDY